MEKGQSRSKANKGMRRFVSGRSFAVLAVPILLSMLVFNRFKKKKKSASSPSSFHPTPAGQGSDRYQVFLSFDGSDTPKEFIDHLYDKLVAAGICVFNHNSIPTGEEFGSLHLDAITRSKISIPIISENYVSSKWFLHQLIHIMDRHKSESHGVLPIFYNVDLSYGWYLIRSLGDEKDIQEGQQALEEVGCLNGWQYEEYAIGHEGELVERVVETVLRELREDSPLSVPKELVGLDCHLEGIMKLTDIPSGHARMIGICGRGGIGKTTLAKCVYNQLWNKFDYVSFLPDIRETTELHNIEYLQSRLISEILHEEIPVSTVSAGTNIIKSRLSGLKVLILLDDIGDSNQLDALAGERNSFASGSIIIVTTRYSYVLYQADFLWEMRELDMGNSLILFSRHAFRMYYPSRDLADISREIVSLTGGIPLVLEIIGSCLYRREPKVWIKMLKRLRKIPLGEVLDKLKIAYDELEDRDKENFLDIACFFIVIGGELATYMGDTRGSYASHGIEQLKLRGLIKIEDDGKLTMHDVLRDLGWNIVCRGKLPWKYNKLWVDEEAFRGLTGEKGTTMTEAFCCDEFCDDPFSYYPNYGLANHLQTYTNGQIKKLRLLRLSDETSSGDLNKFFSEVRWLRAICMEHNPFFSETNLHLPKLVVLHLSHSSITDDWKGWSSITAAKRLKVLWLESFDSLTCTPDLSAFTDLEILIFKNCERLEEVHTSIGKVKSLVSLDLNGCFRLNKLPGEVGELEELKELILDRTGITEIPMSIGSLRKLEKLSANYCISLREIPSSNGDLQNLQHLDISESSIEKLPSDIGRLKTPNLSALPELEIILRDCYRLKQVPPSLGKVKNLVSLDLSGCRDLKKLPGEMGELEELKELILDSTGIMEIPMSIGSLRKLEKLSARDCESLREIPSSIGDLQNLQHLDISESSIEKLPSDIGRLKMPNLSALPELEIILRDCYRLKQVPPSLGKVKNLVSLDLSGCGCLKKLPGEVGELEELKELILDRTGITEIPMSIGSLRKLEKLSARDCESLREIPSSIGDLQNLQHLDISVTPIEKLPSDIGRLQKLRRLHLNSCHHLSGEIPIGDLSSLEILEITEALISDLPDIQNLSSLQHLSLWRCHNLRLLLQLPSGLKYLKASYRGPRLPDFSCLIHLEELVLSWKRST